MTGDEQVTKALTFRREDWTLADVEDTVYRARSAGATDETPVSLRWHELVVEAVPTFPLEVPARPAPRSHPRWLDALAGLLVAVLLAPALAWVIVTVWRLTVGSL